MPLGAWKQPVVVFAGSAGATRWLVGDTAKAAEILARHWPRRAPRDAAYRAACKACLAVLANGADPEKARTAFMAAAREADILGD